MVVSSEPSQSVSVLAAYPEMNILGRENMKNHINADDISDAIARALLAYFHNPSNDRLHQMIFQEVMSEINRSKDNEENQSSQVSSSQ